jgi:hypothetical protein
MQFCWRKRFNADVVQRAKNINVCCAFRNMLFLDTTSAVDRIDARTMTWEALDKGGCAHVVPAVYTFP